MPFSLTPFSLAVLEGCKTINYRHLLRRYMNAIYIHVSGNIFLTYKLINEQIVIVLFD